MKRKIFAVICTVITVVSMLSVFAVPASAEDDVQAQSAIPEGYRLLTADDVGKTFGVDLELEIYIDNTVTPAYTVYDKNGTINLFITSGTAPNGQQKSLFTGYNGEMKIIAYLTKNKLNQTAYYHIYERDSEWAQSGLKTIENIEGETITWVLNNIEWNNWFYVRDTSWTPPSETPTEPPEDEPAEGYEFIKGIYLWKTDFSFNTNITEAVNFTSNNINYSSMKITDEQLIYKAAGEITVCSSDGWHSEQRYQIFDYGRENQEVTLQYKSYIDEHAILITAYEDTYTKDDVDKAWNDGYEEGKEYGLVITETGTWSSIIGSVVEAPINAFQSLFNFELFGMNMADFAKSLITLCIILIIIKYAIRVI